MVGEYQWRQAISKFGVSIVSKACAKLIKLQEHDNWKYPGKTKKKIDTAIRSDMVIIIATLYQFIKDVQKTKLNLYLSMILFLETCQ